MVDLRAVKCVSVITSKAAAQPDFVAIVNRKRQKRMSTTGCLPSTSPNTYLYTSIWTTLDVAAGYEDCQCEKFVYTYSKTWLHIMSEQKHTHIISAITSNSGETISFHKPLFFWGDNYKSCQIRGSRNQNKDSLFSSHRQSAVGW